MILAVILIFTGGCIAGGIAVALLFRNSRRVRTFIAKHLNEKQAAAAAVQLRLAAGPRFVATPKRPSRWKDAAYEAHEVLEPPP